MKKYFQDIVTLLMLIILSFPLIAQEKNLSSEKTEISGGAEFDQMMQEAIKEGNLDMFKPSFVGPPIATGAEGANFLGFNFDDNATENGGFLYIPPDPIGAAGLDRIVAVVNTMIECRNKTGTLLFRDALRDFFSPLLPTTATFDPKVIYDQYENRFVVVTLERVNSGSNPNAGNISRILLAVSKTSTPATATSADWWYYGINGAEVIGGLDYWADYPGFAVDEEAVYITANMFVFPPFTGGPAYTRLWIVNKGTATGFYAGGSATSAKYDFPTLSGGFAGTHQPAHVFGTSGVAPGVGTFLVYYSGVTFGGPGGAEVIQVIRINNPLGAIAWDLQYVNIGDIENVGGSYGFPALVDAPQLGPPAIIPIEVNDRRTLHSVWRDNSLWLTTTINPNSGPDAGQTTAHWIEINTSTLATLVLADQGNIGGEDIAANTYTFFPSIAVNGNKDAMICFSASAATIYGGAYYTGRRFGDPAGTIGPSQTMQAGLDYYIRTFGGARNRWGDYSGASVDPSDDQTFWAFNEYAETRGTPTGPPLEDGRWGTVYASISPTDPLPVELTNFSAEIIDKRINLKWQTATEVDNYGFEIERSLNSSIWQNIGFIEGYGNSNSPKEYSFVDMNVTHGSHLYRLKQIDNDGTFEYSDVIEVDFSSPLEFDLNQNYPNPFNPSTTIKFSLIEKSNVQINLINTLGEKVAELINGNLEAGVHKVEFNAHNLPSGIYFYTINVEGKFSDTKKMLLMK